MSQIVVTTEPEIWALCVWREARGEPYAAKFGVANVIKNRTTDPHNRWPKTIREVILEPRQFSSFNPDDPNYLKYPSPKQPAWKDCQTAVAAVGLADDITKGANHYHSLPPGDPHWPKWAVPEAMTVKLGAFRFYRL